MTTKAGRYVQGGGCTTVGVAGLIQSGGFGSFSKNYGLAASSLLEAEVVTADGVIRIANAFINSDLFWGLKGGGGGSLGVVTKLTLKTHELPKWFGRVSMTIRANSTLAYRRLIGKFVDFYQSELFNPHWGETAGFEQNNLFITMVSQALDEQQSQRVWQPFIDWVTASPQDFKFLTPPNINAMPARYWWDKRHIDVVSDPRPDVPESNWWYRSTQAEVGAYWYGYSSTWLPDLLLTSEHKERLIEVLLSTSQKSGITLHFNKGLAGAPDNIIAAAKDAATNPAVQTAFALAIIGGFIAPAYVGVFRYEPDLAVARKAAAEIGNTVNLLREVVPDAGSYVAEGDFFEKNWQQSFWGANYQRLCDVKKKFDPDGLLFVHHGVGSEGWSIDGFTRFS